MFYLLCFFVTLVSASTCALVLLSIGLVRDIFGFPPNMPKIMNLEVPILDVDNVPGRWIPNKHVKHGEEYFMEMCMGWIILYTEYRDSHFNRSSWKGLPSMTQLYPLKRPWLALWLFTVCLMRHIWCYGESLHITGRTYTWRLLVRWQHASSALYYDASVSMGMFLQTHRCIFSIFILSQWYVKFVWQHSRTPKCWVWALWSISIL